jgi:phosphatidylserine synthase
VVALFFELFYFQTHWGRLPFAKKSIVVWLHYCFLRLSCLFCWKMGSSSSFKILRSSSIFKNIEVVFHISSCWLRIRMYNKNRLHRLPRTAWNVMIPGGGVVVVVVFLPNIIPPQLKLLFWVVCVGCVKPLCLDEHVLMSHQANESRVWV